MEIELITTSRMKAFNACRRLHHYKYELGIRPLVDSAALEFGTIFHAGLEAWWKAYMEGRPLMALSDALAAIAKAAQGSAKYDDAAAAKAELLMLGYHARWAPSMGEYEVIGVELQFVAQMPVPEGAKRVRGLRVAGKLDVLVRKISTGEIFIVEHKTSAADLSPGSTYWQRLRMDTQVSVYFEGATTLGHPPTGCLYDVIAKPGQRPLKATPMELRKYTKEKVNKAGEVVEPSRLYANQRETDETMDEFKARMAADIAANPELFFQRQEVVRLSTEIEESRRDTYDTALMIRETQNAERAPRNPDACLMYGGVCSFYPVCSGIATIDDPTLYRKLDSTHPELDLSDASSR